MNNERTPETDSAIYAKSHGLKVEEVIKSVSFQEVFKKYYHEVNYKYPNQISSAYMEIPPATKGYIQFVDDIPEWLILSIKKNKLDDKIILTDGGKISLDDSHKRAHLIITKLFNKLKNKNFSGGGSFDVIDKVIKVRIKIPKTAEKPSQKSLFELIKTAITNNGLTGRAAILDENDVQFIITRGSKPTHVNDNKHPALPYD